MYEQFLACQTLMHLCGISGFIWEIMATKLWIKCPKRIFHFFTLDTVFFNNINAVINRIGDRKQIWRLSSPNKIINILLSYLYPTILIFLAMTVFLSWKNKSIYFRFLLFLLSIYIYFLTNFLLFDNISEAKSAIR